MPDFAGQFVWYELITTDPAAARSFYADVVGWQTRDVPMPGMTYILALAGETQVAGLMAIPPEAAAMGTPPNWTGYVAVPDVDASAKQATSLGGQVLREPTDIPGVGRFAIVADPQGAVLALFKGADGDGMTPNQAAPGHIGWHELYASELESAFGFYSAMFGWKKHQPMDIGPMGIYQLFGADDPDIGGMMTKPEQMPAAAWLYYFNVGDIDAAASRITAGGGVIHNGPMEVPGPMWVLQAQDPQGAWFAAVGTRG